MKFARIVKPNPNPSPEGRGEDVGAEYILPILKGLNMFNPYTLRIPK